MQHHAGVYLVLRLLLSGPVTHIKDKRKQRVSRDHRTSNDVNYEVAGSDVLDGSEVVTPDQPRDRTHALILP